jgi:hypothetical protein
MNFHWIALTRLKCLIENPTWLAVGNIFQFLSSLKPMNSLKENLTAMFLWWFFTNVCFCVITMGK